MGRERKWWEVKKTERKRARKEVSGWRRRECKEGGEWEMVTHNYTG